MVIGDVLVEIFGDRALDLLQRFTPNNVDWVAERGRLLGDVQELQDAIGRNREKAPLNAAKGGMKL
jgi:hypothetical protein